MKWLVTAAERESPNFHDYLDWVNGADIATEVVQPSQPLPPAEEFDALLLSGGNDIDPVRYGQPRHPETGRAPHDRDDMEFRLLERFLQARRPVLGICRGLQVIQVALGGRLIQHVPELVNPADEQHSQNAGKDSTHRLTWRSQLPIAAVLEGRATACNSSHHRRPIRPLWDKGSSSRQRRSTALSKPWRWPWTMAASSRASSGIPNA